jgi:hypothetical protein
MTDKANASQATERARRMLPLVFCCHLSRYEMLIKASLLLWSTMRRGSGVYLSRILGLISKISEPSCLEQYFLTLEWQIFLFLREILLCLLLMKQAGSLNVRMFPTDVIKNT